MISVLLCTYNGEKYIEKQLQSIIDQTIRPDEVIIKDDCSTDGTISVCEKFIQDNNLAWKVEKNQKNLGYRMNFITGLKETKGDIVFLCDQDDIWKENKVEVMSKLMQDNKIKSLTSTYDLMDDEDRVIAEHIKHPYRRVNDIRQIKPKEFYRFPQYLGMTMAVKREVIDTIDSNQADVVTHDVFLNYYALRMNGLYFLDKSLTRRRSVGTNTSQKVKEEQLKEFGENDRLRIASNILKSLKLFEKLDKQDNLKTDTDLNKDIKTLEKRVNYLQKGKVTRVIKSAFSVCKNAGFKTYIKDLMVVVRGA